MEDVGEGEGTRERRKGCMCVSEGQRTASGEGGDKSGPRQTLVNKDERGNPLLG